MATIIALLSDTHIEETVKPATVNGVNEYSDDRRTPLQQLLHDASAPCSDRAASYAINHLISRFSEITSQETYTMSFGDLIGPPDRGCKAR